MLIYSLCKSIIYQKFSCLFFISYESMVISKINIIIIIVNSLLILHQKKIFKNLLVLFEVMSFQTMIPRNTLGRSQSLFSIYISPLRQKFYNSKVDFQRKQRKKHFFESGVLHERYFNFHSQIYVSCRTPVNYVTKLMA